MDRTTIVIGAVSVSCAWLLGRAERPAVRQEIRRQERAAALARVRVQATRLRNTDPAAADALDAISGQSREAM